MDTQARKIEIANRGEDRDHSLLIEDSNNIRNILILETTFLTAAFLLVAQADLSEKINLALEAAIFMYITSILFYSLLLKEKTGDTMNANFLDVIVQLESFQEFEKYKINNPNVHGKQLDQKLNQIFSQDNFKKKRKERYFENYFKAKGNLLPKYMVHLEHGLGWSYYFALIGNYCFLFAIGACMLAVILFIVY